MYIVKVKNSEERGGRGEEDVPHPPPDIDPYVASKDKTRENTWCNIVHGGDIDLL